MKGIGSRVNANRAASVPCSRSEKIWLRPASDPICSDPGRGKCRPETKDAILQPRLPRKVERRHREPSAPPEPAQSHKCHACQAKCTWMSPSGVTGKQARHQSLSAVSATPALQSAGRCHQVPRLASKGKVDVAKCHACHAKSSGQERATRGSPVP